MDLERVILEYEKDFNWKLYFHQGTPSIINALLE